MRDKLLNLKIGVLMGGVSREREVSLRSGANVLASLDRQGFNVVGIDVQEDFLHQVAREPFDIAFICLHGKFGEDGAIQGLLEMANIPYTGSGVLASALAMNKVATKRMLISENLPTPPFKALDLMNGVREEVQEAEELLGYPMMVKPISEGSSIGVSIVHQRDELDEVLRQQAFKFGKLMIEKYIAGREVTIGILGTNSRARVLPVLELVPKSSFYDYEAKYTEGRTEFILPARLSAACTQRCQSLALQAHRTLGCAGMSRVDMIVEADANPYILEVNTIPGFTELSDLPQQARHASISFDELVFEILKSAYVDHEYKFLSSQDPSKSLSGSTNTDPGSRRTGASGPLPYPLGSPQRGRRESKASQSR